MRFRSKIILVYTFFAGIIMILFMGVYYCLNRQNIIRQECKSVEVLSAQMSRQYEETVNFMETAYSYLIKDIKVLEAIRQLSRLPGKTDYAAFYFSDATNLVQEALLSDYIYSNFYRVVFFNQNGVEIASESSLRKLDPSREIASFEWIQKTDAVPYGEFYVRGAHPDDWGTNKEEVFSIVKKIHGKDLGYVEVQKSAKELEAVFELSEPNTRVLLMDNQENVLFSSESTLKDSGYHGFLSGKDLGAREYINEVTGEKEFAAGSRCVGDTVLLVIKSDESMKKQLNNMLFVSSILAIAFLGIAMVYIYVSANHLTRPVDELKQLMVLTELNPRVGKVEVKAEENEFKAIGESYQNMLNHLNQALEKERRISITQLQAQFDALQAQVNPHFIYNVLNVISGRGMIDNDEIICDICDDLAKILRYSTDTRERYATVRQEAAYLEAYFNLLKRRYEHRLEYKVRISPEIENRIVPKLILQQFVENSISHGFEQNTQIMYIEICGIVDGKGWYVRIRDNGDGFSEEALCRIRKETQKLQKQIKADIQNFEMKIGGMGISNAYVRLCLLYSDRLKFHIGNYGQGAEVIFGEYEG